MLSNQKQVKESCTHALFWYVPAPQTVHWSDDVRAPVAKPTPGWLTGTLLLF